MNHDLIGLHVLLREASSKYDPASAQRAQFWADHLGGIVDYLNAKGISVQDLAPLSDLTEALRSGGGNYGNDDGHLDARTGNAAPSSDILARASAVIDLLMREGRTEEQAAQTVTRKLITAGVNPPESGGDSRGWMRLARWRRKLLEDLMPAEVTAEYESFLASVAEIPSDDRLNRVLTEGLWDRRSR
ncbi:MAG: hypothetical protein ACR2PM_10230 [Hyphomicrobiales bacterium]